jgi:hypothetical protein
MKNNTRLPTQMDWLCTVEFIPEDNGEARLFATEIIGHLFGYAQATNTRALALVGDADANAYELLFSFASSEDKEQFLHLVRTDEDMGNDYIENDFMSPTAEEIRNARPLGTVLPPDVVNHVALIAATLFASREDNRAAS